MKRIGFALVLLLILACNLPAPTLLSTPLSRSPTPIPPLTNLRCRITDLHPTSPHFHPHHPPSDSHMD